MTDTCAEDERIQLLSVYLRDICKDRLCECIRLGFSVVCAENYKLIAAETAVNFAVFAGFFQHVSNIENGNTKLSLIALINIANALEVTTDVLLCDSTYKSKAVLHDDLAELLEVADDDDVRQIVAYAQFWMETGRKINRKGE